MAPNTTTSTTTTVTETVDKVAMPEGPMEPVLLQDSTTTTTTITTQNQTSQIVKRKLAKPSSECVNGVIETTPKTEAIPEITDEEILKDVPTRIVWENVLIFGFLHVGAFYGLKLFLTAQALWQTNLFAVILYIFSGFGITAGAHRLWAHRAYKANLALRSFLCFLNCIAFEKDIYDWCREHRVHHKFTDTNADPHNSTRGFWFSHIGWLMVKKHPAVIYKGSTIDFSDLLRDPVIAFQRKYYYYLVTVCCIILPTVIPNYFWGESLWNAFFVSGMLRYVWTLNCSFMVNSFAHLFGDKPYDVNINPAENRLVQICAIGEGFHNYHHTFPWDYATSEYGFKYNITTAFINFFSAIGWAYDLKMVSQDMIKARIARTGPGHEYKASAEDQMKDF